ncbi:MAG: hypothetical protein A2X49_09910 [Lentisphaerae bacterium GWF2_52_8]|nr:MAG: hypothetical protein A2X49_09910 [Lentisphaerae bacterium GWF2_52_8]
MKKLQLFLAIAGLPIMGILAFFLIRMALSPQAPPATLPAPTLQEVSEKYEDGQLKAKYSVFTDRKNVKTGLFTEYYPNGSRKFECNYQENIAEGPFTYCYEDGTKAMSGTLKRGKMEGELTEWHPNGNIKLSYKCLAGVREGHCTEYYDQKGLKMIESSFSNGLLNGPCKYYKLDGTIKYELFYENGKEAPPPPATPPSKDKGEKEPVKTPSP